MGSTEEFKRAPARRVPRPLPEPTAAYLQAAAMTHLARYAATEAGLTRVLRRKLDRWARQAEADPEVVAAVAARGRAAIAGIVARLAASGAVSDQAFAQSRARSLARAGRSHRAVGAHLASRGVPGALAEDAARRSPEQEMAAALIHARKRRLGPWRRAAPEPELRRRELANMARAGFAQDVARAALGMDADEAELRIIRFREAL